MDTPLCVDYHESESRIYLSNNTISKQLTMNVNYIKQDREAFTCVEKSLQHTRLQLPVYNNSKHTVRDLIPALIPRTSHLISESLAKLQKDNTGIGNFCSNMYLSNVTDMQQQ